jgi:hypothetical protein
VFRTWSATVPGSVAMESWAASGGSSQFTAARVLRWSPDGRQLAFAWNSSAIRVLDPPGRTARADAYRLPRGNTHGQGGVESNLADFETECSAQTAYPDGAYIGWANADGSTVIGSLLWDGHARFGMFRDGRFTPLPALPVSVPVSTGVLIGTYDW